MYLRKKLLSDCPRSPWYKNILKKANVNDAIKKYLNLFHWIPIYENPATEPTKIATSY
jgi:hypothetical protein